MRNENILDGEPADAPGVGIEVTFVKRPSKSMWATEPDGPDLQ